MAGLTMARNPEDWSGAGDRQWRERRQTLSAEHVFRCDYKSSLHSIDMDKLWFVNLTYSMPLNFDRRDQR